MNVGQEKVEHVRAEGDLTKRLKDMRRIDLEGWPAMERMRDGLE